MATITKKKPWERKKKHTDSYRVKGARRITFTIGRNGCGARMDGKRVELKRKWS